MCAQDFSPQSELQDDTVGLQFKVYSSSTVSGYMQWHTTLSDHDDHDDNDECAGCRTTLLMHAIRFMTALF